MAVVESSQGRIFAFDDWCHGHLRYIANEYISFEKGIILLFVYAINITLDFLAI